MAFQPFSIRPANLARGSLRAAAAAILVSAGCTALTTGELESPQPHILLGSSSELERNAQGMPGEPHLSEQQQRQLQIFRAILLSPSTEVNAETRRDAAQELLAMEVPQALAVVADALRSETPAAMLAAVTAMRSGRPVPELLDPAIAALTGADADVIESLALEIARRGEPAVHRVAPLATNTDRPTAARLGAIQALGAFESQSAAAALMQIIDRDNEVSEVVSAACASLSRVTGRTTGNDIQQWRAWWSQARDLAPHQWSEFINQSLSKRAIQLQEELQEQRLANERIARELFAAYRDLYPTLPVEEQWRRLTVLLQDPAPQLREFAIARISLLVRDSVRIPPEVQHKLAGRLDDELPALRIETVKLLDENNDEAIGRVLAARLNAEQNTGVVAAILDVLGRRSSPVTIQAARPWLSDEELGNRAANATWRALLSHSANEDELEALRRDLRSALATRQLPGLLRLLALIGAETDVTRLSEQLDRDNSVVCASIAEGFCERGLHQPLIHRAANPAIYPFALRAIVRGRADLPALRQLLELAPEESAKPIWLDACKKLCESLPVSDLMAADDLLLASTLVDSSVRLALLDRATSQVRPQLSREDLGVMAARHAALLIVTGEPIKAHLLLDSIGCSDPGVLELCFEAAALSGNYDMASQLHDTSAAWVTLLVSVANRDLMQAGPLLNEITRRFEGQLPANEVQQVNRVAQLIRNAAASASTSGFGFAFPR